MTAIEWDSVLLRQLSDADLPLLYKWRNEFSFLSNLTARSSSPTFESFKAEFDKDFSTDRHIQLIICHNNISIGTIYSYSLNKLDKYCFISVFVEDVFHKSGVGAKAAILFCIYLFTEYDLFKIYFDTYEYNHHVIGLLSKRNIAIEGKFLNQHLQNDKRYDVIRFAIYERDISNWEYEYIKKRRTQNSIF